MPSVTRAEPPGTTTWGTAVVKVRTRSPGGVTGKGFDPERRVEEVVL